jgi:D-alanine-D-alanine ligase
MMNIPYTGSDVLSSALAMNKAKCKEVYIYNGINVPDFIACNYYEWKKNEGELIGKSEDKLGYPCVVKPANLGSSVGTYIVKNREDMIKRISNAFEYDNTILIEKYLKGIEVTCAVLGGKSGEEPVAFPLTEIVPPDDAEFFDYDVKYDGTTREITPARISRELTSTCQEIAVKVHKILGCGGMSRTDMIIIDNNIYVLETNTIPGMTKQSLYPQAAASMGIEFPDLLDKIIDLAIDTFKNKKVKTERK